MSDSEDTPTKVSRPAVIVDYCKVCSLPTEYCEYGPSAKECLKVNGPHKNNNKNTPASGDAAPADSSTSTTTTTSTTTEESDSNTEKLKDLKIVDDSKEISHVGAGEENDKEKEDKAASSKKKKEVKKTIIIEVNQRNKRKHITNITGLELYGIKLADSQKLMAKKFSCGCSVIKDTITIQGDFKEELVDFIEEKYPDIPLSDIYFLEEGKKVKAR
ncbi:hypothetical protein DICPUDRAFT_96741 [Dictyostelium purpureum]|uniref:SUI1 domain-containing protein n=1 Tax=Dictyostelium purpureum TaxID=5786 RepID=F0ZAV0_DICPU|nr:uncharacterized protein DICPUDRAFT_96741 [Dictyostelium purpureum]EGC38952.1 hypothetical protein DICPUDRAFT_96741 [Dictyostelium purpureum]|eukprot:XP_003284517.1 hypothetical protein DICPUDRAFT_96741 [Dictyostelium purpureum]